MRICILAALLITFSSPTSADCFTTAARNTGFSEDLLRAIAQVESNYNPSALNPQTHALGVMQILPSNFPSIQKALGITASDLRQACKNIEAGAWILLDFKKQYGAVWRAVGGYGVGNGKSKKIEMQRMIYAGKVKKALIAIRSRKHPVVLVSAPTPPRPVAVIYE